MVGSRQTIPRRDTSTPSATTQQQDFYFWLRRLPFGFLQDLYRQYLLKKGNLFEPKTLQVAPPTQLFPSTNTDKSPPHKKEVIVLRRSIFFLIGAIISIELFFDFAYIALKLIPVVFTFSPYIQNLIAPLYVILFIAINILKVIFMIVTAFGWIATRYELREGEIRFKYGLIFINEKIYLSTYTQEVTCEQSFFGRLFNYGTIQIFNPVIKEAIYLDSIPNPHKYVEIIKGTLPKLPETGLLPL